MKSYCVRSDCYGETSVFFSQFCFWVCGLFGHVYLEDMLDKVSSRCYACQLTVLNAWYSLFHFREGFRSRLENIVRGQVSNHSDTTLVNDTNYSISDHQENTPQDIQQEDDEQSQPRNQEAETHQLSEQSDPQSDAAVDNSNWQENSNQGDGLREQTTNDYDQFNERGDGNAEPMDADWQENAVNNWPQETPGNVHGQETQLQESQEVWREDNVREAVESRREGPSDPPRMRRAFPMRRYNRFHPPDDDNVYSMELRELLSRYFVVQKGHLQC